MTRRFRLYLRRYLPVGLIVLITLGVMLSIKLSSLTGVTTHIKASLPARVKGNDASFVTRSGTSLLLNGQPFRFSGANIYWLGLEEVNTGDGIAYPSQFQVDDALATAQVMGATVVRSHTLGISVGCSICVEPTLGAFNQMALQTIDYAIQSAHTHGIRLIIPLVDNWHFYHGGKHTFTDWRGISDENQFYTNPQVISDFEQYVSVLLNHVNTYTGIAYKDDPTIMTWELGNELSAPASWVQLMANYIKSIDPHHLVMDGNYEQANETANFLPDLSIPAIDMYTGHYYPPTASSFLKEAQQAYAANKVFVVGEFDWNILTPTDINNFLKLIQNSTASGDLYWSLFPHADNYGFVYRKEHYTLHYPGDTLDMRNRVNLLRQHAFAMQNMPAPGVTLAGTPVITFVSSSGIAWRGTAGADTYSIERSTVGVNGPWMVICNQCATDNTGPWIDPSRPQGNVWYRMRAYSSWGNPSSYSNVYHPVIAKPVKRSSRALTGYRCPWPYRSQEAEQVAIRL
ncbi:MAG TPA: cellulase family glycosylhydrolase [Ktedonobacteraceae bacterium]